MTTAERIDQYLKENSISRRQLAIKAKIPPSTLQSAIERNTSIPVAMIVKIAEALNISAYQILGDDEQPIFISGLDTGLVDLRKKGYTFSKNEELLVRLFNLLNPQGKEEALARLEELTELKKFSHD